MTARAGWVSFGTFSVCRLNLINTKAVGGRRTTAGSWDSSGSHYGPVGSGQQTLVGGDWEVNSKQRVGQQYPASPRAEVRETASVRLWQRDAKAKPLATATQKKKRKKRNQQQQQQI